MPKNELCRGSFLSSCSPKLDFFFLGVGGPCHGFWSLSRGESALICRCFVNFEGLWLGRFVLWWTGEGA